MVHFHSSLGHFLSWAPSSHPQPISAPSSTLCPGAELDAASGFPTLGVALASGDGGSDGNSREVPVLSTWPLIFPPQLPEVAGALGERPQLLPACPSAPRPLFRSVSGLGSLLFSSGLGAADSQGPQGPCDFPACPSCNAPSASRWNGLRNLPFSGKRQTNISLK